MSASKKFLWFDVCLLYVPHFQGYKWSSNEVVDYVNI